MHFHRGIIVYSVRKEIILAYKVNASRSLQLPLLRIANSPLPLTLFPSLPNALAGFQPTFTAPCHTPYLSCSVRSSQQTATICISALIDWSSGVNRNFVHDLYKCPFHRTQYFITLATVSILMRTVGYSRLL
jgi:hypothetical protein